MSQFYHLPENTFHLIGKNRSRNHDFSELTNSLKTMVSKNKRIFHGLLVFLFLLYGLSHGIIVIWDAMHQKKMQKCFKSLLFVFTKQHLQN